MASCHLAGSGRQVAAGNHEGGGIRKGHQQQPTVEFKATTTLTGAEGETETEMESEAEALRRESLLRIVESAESKLRRQLGAGEKSSGGGGPDSCPSVVGACQATVATTNSAMTTTSAAGPTTMKLPGASQVANRKLSALASLKSPAFATITLNEDQLDGLRTEARFSAEEGEGEEAKHGGPQDDQLTTAATAAAATTTTTATQWTTPSLLAATASPSTASASLADLVGWQENDQRAKNGPHAPPQESRELQIEHCVTNRQQQQQTSATIGSDNNERQDFASVPQMSPRAANCHDHCGSGGGGGGEDAHKSEATHHQQGQAAVSDGGGVRRKLEAAAGEQDARWQRHLASGACNLQIGAGDDDDDDLAVRQWRRRNMTNRQEPPRRGDYKEHNYHKNELHCKQTQLTATDHRISNHLSQRLSASAVCLSPVPPILSPKTPPKTQGEGQRLGGCERAVAASEELERDGATPTNDLIRQLRERDRQALDRLAGAVKAGGSQHPIIELRRRSCAASLMQQQQQQQLQQPVRGVCDNNDCDDGQRGATEQQQPLDSKRQAAASWRLGQWLDVNAAAAVNSRRPSSFKSTTSTSSSSSNSSSGASSNGAGGHCLGPTASSCGGRCHLPGGGGGAGCRCGESSNGSEAKLTAANNCCEDNCLLVPIAERSDQRVLQVSSRRDTSKVNSEGNGDSGDSSSEQQTSRGNNGREEAGDRRPETRRNSSLLDDLICKCHKLKLAAAASAAAASSTTAVVGCSSPPSSARAGAGSGQQRAPEEGATPGRLMALSPYRLAARAAQTIHKAAANNWPPAACRQRKPSDPTSQKTTRTTALSLSSGGSGSRDSTSMGQLLGGEQRRHSTYVLPMLLLNQAARDAAKGAPVNNDDDEDDDDDEEEQEEEQDDNDDDDSVDDNEEGRQNDDFLWYDDATSHSVRYKQSQASPGQQQSEMMNVMKITASHRSRRRIGSKDKRGAVRKRDGGANQKSNVLAQTAATSAALLRTSASSPSALSTPTNEGVGCGGPCCSNSSSSREQARSIVEKRNLQRGNSPEHRREPPPIFSGGDRWLETETEMAPLVPFQQMGNLATNLMTNNNSNKSEFASSLRRAADIRASKKSYEQSKLRSAAHHLKTTSSGAEATQPPMRQRRIGSNPLDSQLCLSTTTTTTTTTATAPMAIHRKYSTNNADRDAPPPRGAPINKRHSIVNLLSNSNNGINKTTTTSSPMVPPTAHGRSQHPRGSLFSTTGHSLALFGQYTNKTGEASSLNNSRRRTSGGDHQGCHNNSGGQQHSIAGGGGSYSESCEHYDQLIPESGFKIVVMGTSGCGKTAIIHRFLYGTFSARHLPTVEDTYFIEFPYKKNQINISVSDTSGTYQFPAMKKLAINSGDAFILVYSVDDPQSFDDLEQLRETILSERELAYLEATSSLTSNDSSGLSSGAASCGSHGSGGGGSGCNHNRLNPTSAASHRDVSPSRHWSLASLFNHHHHNHHHHNNTATETKNAAGGGGVGASTTTQTAATTTTNHIPLGTHASCSLSSSSVYSNSYSHSSSSCSSSADNSRRSSISAAEAALKTRRTPRPPMVVVANKHDLPKDKHLVNSDEIEALAVIDWNNGFVRASAALNWNIDEIFQQVLKQARQPPTLSQAIVSERRKSLPPKLPHHP